MVVAASTETEVAVGIGQASSAACGIQATVALPLPPPTSPPISTLPPPACPEASIFAPNSAMFSPVIATVPPVCFAFLPATEIEPDTLTVWTGVLTTLVDAVAVPSTTLPFWDWNELASMTPVLLITESTTLWAVAAVSVTWPPLALRRPSFLTNEPSGSPVATSLTSAAIESPTASLRSWSP